MRTYHGSCHCGAVRFSVDMDLARGTLRCNCTICSKLNLWTVQVAPPALRLLAGATDLSDYQFHSRREHHFFCRHCGVRPFGKGDSPRHGPFYAINLAALDDAAGDLATAPVRSVDGRNDNWDGVPS